MSKRHKKSDKHLLERLVLATALIEFLKVLTELIKEFIK